MNPHSTARVFACWCGQASDARDGVVKAVYSKMFDWIVSMINENIRPTEHHSMFIGVLDIFGFEVRFRVPDVGLYAVAAAAAAATAASAAAPC